VNLEVREGAVQDLKQFDKQIQEQIRDGIKRLVGDPLGENTSLLSKQGLEIYRLKLKTSELDHRVFYDLDGDRVVVLGVEHRDDAYTQESIEKIRSRE
jgi:mRNA-degrading endonuclease RelE of RelBE toxin-antitoxin system